MKHSLAKWQFGGFVFVSVLGILLHFLYDWSGENMFLAPISAVNESIWEHMKILFVPMFLYAILEHRFVSSVYPKFWCAKLWGILCGVLLIPVLYYTIQGAFGGSPDWVNIAIYFLVAASVFLLETHMLKHDHVCCKQPSVAFVVLCFLMVLFAILTFITPRIPLFADPIDRTYGV